jgi:hypothetical protein
MKKDKTPRPGDLIKMSPLSEVVRHRWDSLENSVGVFLGVDLESPQWSRLAWLVCVGDRVLTFYPYYGWDIDIVRRA